MDLLRFMHIHNGNKEIAHMRMKREAECDQPHMVSRDDGKCPSGNSIIPFDIPIQSYDKHKYSKQLEGPILECFLNPRQEIQNEKRFNRDDNYDNACFHFQGLKDELKEKTPHMNNKYCIYCGMQINKSSNYCPFCGKKLMMCER
jgi:hypothetical protein